MTETDMLTEAEAEARAATAIKAISQSIEAQLIAIYGRETRHALIIMDGQHADVVATMGPVDIVDVVTTLFGDADCNVGTTAEQEVLQ